MGWTNPRFKADSPGAARPSVLVVDQVRIFDAASDAVVPNGRIVIRDGRIETLGPVETVAAIPGAQTVDGRGATALPGLIDTHVHLSWNGVFEPYPPQFGEPVEQRLRRNASITLNSGVTTVREMPGFGAVGLKEAIASGQVAGPRVLASTAALSVKGGYFAYPLWGTVIKKTADIPAILDHKLERGCDFIKTVAPHADAGRRQRNMPAEMLAAIVEAADSRGLRVAAHTMWTDGVDAAIDAGVSSLEHCPPYVGGALTDAQLARIKQQGIVVVPTADLLRRNYQMFHHRERLVQEPAYQHNMPAKSRAKMLRMAERMDRYQAKKAEAAEAFTALFLGFETDHPVSFAKALEHGVRIAAGTDSGTNYGPHGILPLELARYVELGMAPRQAIHSATTVASELLNMDDEIGTLEPGKRADVLLVHGDPLTDTSALTDVHTVIKDGAVEYRSDRSQS